MTEEYAEYVSEEHKQLALRWKKQCRIRLEWALRYARNHNIKFI